MYSKTLYCYKPLPLTKNVFLNEFIIYYPNEFIFTTLMHTMGLYRQPYLVYLIIDGTLVFINNLICDADNENVLCFKLTKTTRLSSKKINSYVGVISVTLPQSFCLQTWKS